MDQVDDFPYRAEYAKSNRSSCRSCKSNIGKGSLRLAAMVQSPSFDGKMPQWYHHMCFFSKQRPKDVQDIAHFDSLRWEDQQKIKEKIGNLGSAPPVSGGSKKKSTKKTDKNFSIEYAKSGRAACKGCEEKILKDVIRISALDFESDKARRFGPIPQWHHVDCFVVLRKEMQYFDAGADLNGFNTLSADDKKIIREKIKPIQRVVEDVADSPVPTKSSAHDDDLSRKQNVKIFAYRDLLEKNLNKSEMITLLEFNKYDPLTGESRILDTLADLMTFGSIDRCETCKIGNLIYKSGVGYICSGSISEWTKCTSVVDTPKRNAFLVPEELKEEFPFLKKYKYKNNGNRALVKRVLTESQGVKRKVIEKSKPLEDLTFVIVGSKFVKSKKEIKEKILSLGGEVSSTIGATTAAVITTKDVVDAISKQIMPAKEHGVECVPEEFLDEIEAEGVMLLIREKNMASWAKDVEQRLSKLKKLKSTYKSRLISSDSKYELNQDKMKITLKGGGHIDSESGLSDSCHVYKASEKLYSVVLGMVDLAKKVNSYYKLQVLESDDNRSWYVYRSWGRIGTTIGGHKVEDKLDLQDAIRDFNDLYEQKTGNKFKSKDQKKLAGFWYPLDIDHGEKSDKLQELNVKKSKSKLAKQIQELVALLFDVKLMENTMVEYELDLKKMPLGKLSQKQVENAYKVLSEAMEWIEKLKNDGDEKPGKATGKETDVTTIKNHLLDCSNRFYTLIPHDFGMKNPPLLDNEEYIKSKIDMVDSLKEIEIAYNLLKTEGGGDAKMLDPIDQCYKKLKTDVDVLDKASQEFKMISTYIKNTHAATHSHYTLKLDEVFIVKRHGEEKLFKPFKKLHNRQLLWHGSRLTNFVGILSQGLRIAPPEAPPTGYMFGKGVYFADMVSKSANYCSTSPTNPTGLLLLCDVALGDMYELKGAKYITKLPSGKHSTKGMGRTHPNPDKTMKLEDGVQVPLGQSKEADVKNTTLLYNEYIVYDTSQINIKYLLKTSFKYKY